MSQNAPVRAQAADAAANAADFSRSAIDDSSTASRHNHHAQFSTPSYSSVGSLPSPSYRSIRAPIPASPLSHKPASTPTSPQESQTTFRSADLRTRPNELASTEQTTFYTDSSANPSPEPASPRSYHEGKPDATRSVSDPLTRRPEGSSPIPRLPMAGPVAVAQGEAAKSVPRNSSIDSAISAMSSNSNPRTDGTTTPDIGNLIKTAGSAEGVIKYLLKEKNSQSQQNQQLWRLVDKQRAMILGLNKDLERALKDKEKYRTKLKELMATSSVAPRDNPQIRKTQEAQLPRVDVHAPREQTAYGPDSPTLESDDHKSSPIHMAMAPYPITPPADQAPMAMSAVREVLDPAHAMPKAHEHALGQFDHEAQDRAADAARKQKMDEELETIPYSVGLPPSRNHPGGPPTVPLPAPPITQPTFAVVEATPNPNEGLGQFPAPPPRKPPPAPLQLKKDLRPDLGPAPEDDDGDSDSDYDDLLEVDEILTQKRGRRRTRAEDERVREIQAVREAEARSASKKSKSSKPTSPDAELPQDPLNTVQQVHPEMNAASLDAVMHGDAVVTRELVVPSMANAGLPASPRPMGPKSMTSPPLSPRGVPMSMAAAPLSPRPPRQPIPLPPNTPLATPAQYPGNDGALKSPRPIVSTQTGSGDGVPQSATGSLTSPTERTKVYTGLVTDEYPDLLLPPNALPSVAIRVASSRMKPSRASLMSLTQLEEDPVFTLAVISRADGGELWRVEKDSPSLGKLDSRLKQCPSFTTKAPDRSLFSGHSPAKLDARRVALESYMDELLNTPLDTPTALELCKYLSANTLPPNADETGSSLDGSTSEGSGHKLGPEGLPYRNGYLTKKGKNFGGWKARFFVLDGPQLKYFEAPGGAHLGTIKLPKAQIGKQSQSQENSSPTQANTAEDLDNQYRHAFLVLEPKKKDSNSHVKHLLCAESDKERDLWVDALLQWIEYRDPDEESTRPHPHERQAAAATERTTAKIRKGSSKHTQQADPDALIGVRYDATNAGDAPQSAPRSGKSSNGHPEQLHTPSFADTMSSQPKLISGPKDGQVISDTAAWGNKASTLAAPSYEEKKARKRSFFGFGPKTRSSSDGQDALFGADSSTAQNGYSGPVRQAFGAPLAEAVRYNPPADVNVPLPAVVFRCIQYLDAKNAVLEEGIFRLSGSNIVIKQLRERFNTEGDINLLTDDQFYDMHAIASLLKLYLRELPTTILTRDLHTEFLASTEMTNKDDKLATMGLLVQRLPQANATLLKYLIAFLIKIINNADVNKMTVRNVGIVFSPTLNIPAPVFATFLQNYETIFGLDPDEYELPSPISEDTDNYGRTEPPQRFEPPPARPTTSGSASPHRQPRTDSMQHYQRSTPTPPLTNFGQQPRGSPGPAGGPRQMYDQSYGAQQGSGNPGSRPGYENKYNGQAAAYDESHGNLMPYDPSYGSGTSNKRRESAIFMGGLQPQGSRSRLREETRF